MKRERSHSLRNHFAQSYGYTSFLYFDMWSIPLYDWYCLKKTSIVLELITHANKRTHLYWQWSSDLILVFINQALIQIMQFSLISCHCSDVIMNAMESQITGVLLFAQPFFLAQIKENTKAPRHWPLWGVTGEFPAQRASNAEIVSIWLRHHASEVVVVYKWPPHKKDHK